jgi:hypothetical protein
MTRTGFGILACVALAISPFAAQAGVTATNVWVRGTVPVQRATGAFATLTSSEDAKLVEVKSPAAKIVEIHTMDMTSGIMRMHAVDSIALPAGKPVALAPGGYHVMMIGLVKPLTVGEKVPLTFVVEDSKGKRTSLEVQADVKPLTR